ncbi:MULTISPECIES: ABC transporter ATP-binding protein [unclassified Clostridioides]|uniref:ABC transporter ATP-binding protein n=1 Tax=unclassified Clostridioides TaxID=2635829 RepID=UPI001D11E227|nr:ABC transporter ATP-binding protein [Clostridioides sp. ZZV14-6150]MCC0661277.1 ABC transporter ATP-binding protein [Clostridioides sp. ZZV14-6154]MCC0669099.1 ABC transporter ATP-binding protein [Clostridioides sp. ZZV14-6153]MCC0719459.1 ABC transporter ATP-binding protein [Clostridioides sp. ZZV14-6105]MCC0723086.1 ABC transporter ATP-binding protein [Clostridioides sp. ZZV14-6104]MCC0731024.1 ABC transporter ATP-binding protein [Clostridioides sp. ZZV14-6048]MCC0735443.1 ABC transporte
MLKVNNLCKSYKTGNKTYPVLKNISFEINKGEFVAIMGASGSGKTTLLNCISCFIPIDEGEITLGNNNIRNLQEKELSEVRNQQLGFVFQDFMLFDGLSVFENICVPQIIKGGQVIQMENRATSLCKLFGIEHIRKKYPAEISGGEKQRTAVARALMNNPDLILADEPTGNLDSKSCRTVIDSFLKAKQELDATIFMVTHDSFAASFCDRVIVLKDGMVYKEVVKSNSRREFLDELLELLKEMGGGQDDN